MTDGASDTSRFDEREAAFSAVARASLTSRFSDAESKAVENARKLRARARLLRSEVAQGGYDSSQLTEFWSILEISGLTLRASTSELRDNSDGLTAHFFTSVVRDRRRPKLNNMLKALTAVLRIADERLLDLDRAEEQVDLANVAWIPNPAYWDRLRSEDLERQLRDLIEALRTNNHLAADPNIDAYWRTSLIDTLETVVQLLKAPLIEKGIIQGAASGLKKLSSKIASDSSAGFFGGAAGVAALELLKLLG